MTYRAEDFFTPEDHWAFWVGSYRHILRMVERQARAAWAEGL